MNVSDLLPAALEVAAELGGRLSRDALVAGLRSRGLSVGGRRRSAVHQAVLDAAVPQRTRSTAAATDGGAATDTMQQSNAAPGGDAAASLHRIHELDRATGSRVGYRTISAELGVTERASLQLPHHADDGAAVLAFHAEPQQATGTG